MNLLQLPLQVFACNTATFKLPIYISWCERSQDLTNRYNFPAVSTTAGEKDSQFLRKGVSKQWLGVNPTNYRLNIRLYPYTTGEEASGSIHRVYSNTLVGLKGSYNHRITHTSMTGFSLTFHRYLQVSRDHFNRLRS